MRILLGVVCLLLAAHVQAQAVEHRSGDFQYSIGPVPAFVARHPLPAQWDKDAPGAADSRWRSWLYDMQVDRRSGRNDERYIEVVYEPKSPSLISDAGRFQINFVPAYQKLTIHQVELRRADKWQDRLRPERISLARRESGFEQDIADGSVTALIVLDDVRTDDVIRVSYTVTGSNPILAGQIADSAYLAWRNPVLDSHFRALYDPGTKLKTHRENDATPTTVRNTGEAVEAGVHTHGSAAVVYEDNYPAWFQPYPIVQVSVDRSWSDVVTWALPLYPKIDRLPQDLEARIAEWSKLPAPRHRLKSALRAVQDEVRYFGVEIGENSHRPTPPAETWTRRYGDCKDKAYLLSTLLERMGIRAMPALVSTERGRAIADFLPAASVFNHVIVKVYLGDAVVWVDPTIPQQGGNPGDFDLSAYGVALPIAAGVTKPETIAPARTASTGVGVEEHFEAAENGHNVNLRVETVYQGRSADHARRSIASQRKTDLSRQYADYYRKRYGDLSAAGDPVFNDDREANTLRVIENYTIASPYEDASGGMKAIEIYAEALQNSSALPPTMSRRGPLDFYWPGRFQHRVQIDLPEFWRAPPERDEVQYASPAFGFKRNIAISAGKVEVSYDMQVKEPELPTDKVASHLEQLRKVRDTLSVRLNLQTAKNTLQPEERDKRLKNLLNDVIQHGAKP